MSMSSIISTINRLQRELAEIASKTSQEIRKEADIYARINQIQRSITKSISQSSLNSKLSEIERKHKDLASISTRKAQLAKNEADKHSALLKARQDLAKEEERQSKNTALERDRILKKEAEAEKRRQRETLDFQRKIKQELAASASLAQISIETTPLAEISEVEYDLFISHASQDKAELVEPLAVALRDMGVKVWYDKFAFKIGDNLRRKIDQGLSKSRFGVIVLSPSFFAREWPQYELDGLVAKEGDGGKVILPVWHKVSKDEVLKFSPSLSNRYALKSSDHTILEIAEEIAAVVHGQ